MAEAIENGKTGFPDFKDALDHMPVAILIVDRVGRIVFSNNRFQTQTGLERARTLPLATVFSGDAKSLLEKLENACRGDWIALPLRSVRSRSRTPMRFHVEPLPSPEGEVAYYMLSAHTAAPSSSAHARLDAAVSKTEVERMREQVIRLQERYQRIERFSFVAAHDLRAPLRNISALLDYIEEDFGASLPEAALAHFGTVRKNMVRLQSLVCDLLAHARAETGKVELSEVDVRPLLSNVNEGFSEAIGAGATIRFSGKDATVRADPMLLRQMLENLIGNALKYRDAARPLTVDVSLDRTPEGQRRLSVRDNGIGFEPRFAEQIFEPFQRLHSTQEIEGSGVGLSTVRAICDRLNWRVSAQGTLGEGADFTVTGDF